MIHLQLDPKLKNRRSGVHPQHPLTHPRVHPQHPLTQHPLTHPRSGVHPQHPLTHPRNRESENLAFAQINSFTGSR